MYTLDQSAARDADNIGAYLKDSGKYKGTFIRAENLTSKNKGTKGIGFTFEDTNKRTARFDLWTMDKDGKPLPSFKAVMAIMTCLRQKTLTPVMAEIDRYNYDEKKNEKVQAEVFKELTGKPIGVVLRSTEYEKMKDGVKTGQYDWRLELMVPFDAASELTASEILDKKTQPEKLAAIVAGLEDKPLKKSSAPASHAQNEMPAFDDDIPF